MRACGGTWSGWRRGGGAPTAAWRATCPAGSSGSRRRISPAARALPPAHRARPVAAPARGGGGARQPDPQVRRRSRMPPRRGAHDGGRGPGPPRTHRREAPPLSARADPERGGRGRAAHRQAARAAGRARRAARQPDPARRGWSATSPGPAGSTCAGWRRRCTRPSADAHRPAQARILGPGLLALGRAARGARGRGVRAAPGRLAGRRRGRLLRGGHGRRQAHRQPPRLRGGDRAPVPAPPRARRPRSRSPARRSSKGWLPGLRLVERVTPLGPDAPSPSLRTTRPATGTWPGRARGRGGARAVRRHLAAHRRAGGSGSAGTSCPDYGLQWEIDEYLDRDLVLARGGARSRRTAA